MGKNCLHTVGSLHK